MPVLSRRSLRVVLLTLAVLSVGPVAGADAAGPDLLGVAASGGLAARQTDGTTPTSPVPTSPVPTTPVPTTPPAAPAEPSVPKGRCIDDAAVARARAYARGRPGKVSFAVFEHATVRSSGGGVRYRSASIVKAMVLVADLRRHSRYGAPLTGADRSRLTAMIRRSDNVAATATFSRVGRDEVLRVARAVGMRGFSVGNWWGTSQVTASDQARFFGRLHSVLPVRYRAFARRLLRTIVHEQVWGGAPVARSHGYATLFKSGWLPRGDGWVVHQGLRVERGGCTLGLAVLTGKQRSMNAGITSIRGVVERLL